MERGDFESNDYYPFGWRHEAAGSDLSGNRFKYNGKELQTTGALGYLDYGVRMYDPKVGRWFGMDPLSEKYYSQSSYNYCGNSPVLFIDPNGEDYWSTNNPVLIAGFLNSLRNGYITHDFYGWEHATDADITGSLTYNDETRKYYTSYGDVINGTATRVGLSFAANFIPIVETFAYKGALVREPLSGFWEHVGYYTGIGGYDEYSDGIVTWNVNPAGRITHLVPMGGVAPTPGMKGGGGFLKGLGRVGEDFHKATKGGMSMKEAILKNVGKNNYKKFVGINPNIIKGKDGYLYLEGTGPFKGKNYKTVLLYSDFFD